MTRWSEAGADPLADLQAVHAYLGRGLSMAEATGLLLHPADAALLAPGRAVDHRLLTLAGARLTGQPSPVEDALDDLVARWRGQWWAADPYAATGEEHLGEVVLADLVVQWMRAHDEPLTSDQVRLLQGWFGVLPEGRVPGVPQRAEAGTPGGVPPSRRGHPRHTTPMRSVPTRHGTPLPHVGPAAGGRR